MLPQNDRSNINSKSPDFFPAIGQLGNIGYRQISRTCGFRPASPLGGCLSAAGQVFTGGHHSNTVPSQRRCKSSLCFNERSGNALQSAMDFWEHRQEEIATYQEPVISVIVIV